MGAGGARAERAGHAGRRLQGLGGGEGPRLAARSARHVPGAGGGAGRGARGGGGFRLPLAPRVDQRPRLRRDAERHAAPADRRLARPADVPPGRGHDGDPGAGVPAPAGRLAARHGAGPRLRRRGGQGRPADLRAGERLHPDRLAGARRGDLRDLRARPPGGAAPAQRRRRPPLGAGRLPGAPRRLPTGAGGGAGALRRPPLPLLPLAAGAQRHPRPQRPGAPRVERRPRPGRDVLGRGRAGAPGNASAARVRPFLERQVPAPRGARHARLAGCAKHRAALGLRGADPLPGGLPADLAQRHPAGRDDPRLHRLGRRQPGPQPSRPALASAGRHGGRGAGPLRAPQRLERLPPPPRLLRRIGADLAGGRHDRAAEERRDEIAR